MGGILESDYQPQFAGDTREARLERRIHELEAQLDEARKAAEWRRCLETKPPTGAAVTIVWSGTVQHVAYRRVGIGYACAGGYEWVAALHSDQDPIPDEQVTHWKPLPDPPKEARQ